MTNAELERNTVRKIQMRIIPLLSLAFLFSWLDRVNVSFAALQMNRELGFSNTIFGLGAGFFAIGYVLFSIPGTLLMRRVGTREWLTFTLTLCGVCSAAMALIRTPADFYAVRAILGMAEASIVPTMIAYFGQWLPSEYRGRAVSTFLLVTPFALVTGGPASAALLELHGSWGLAGWQWLFLLEGVPPIIIALVVFLFLNNRPREARWLSAEQTTWLEQRLEDEGRGTAQKTRDGAAFPASLAFRSRRMLILSVINFGFGIAVAGPLFFLPLIIRTMGYSTLSIGFLSALPAVAAGVTLPLWGRWADRAARREAVMMAAGFMIAAGFLVAAAALPSPLAFIGLILVSAGLYGSSVVNVLLPSGFLKGEAAAAGIALTSTSISLGTFVGSYLIGRLSDSSGGFMLPMMALSAVVMIATLLLSALMRRSGPSAPAAEA